MESEENTVKVDEAKAVPLTTSTKHTKSTVGLKGNVDIIDETKEKYEHAEESAEQFRDIDTDILGGEKDEVLPSSFKQSEDSVRIKGNVDIIDETKDRCVKESSENGNQIEKSSGDCVEGEKLSAHILREGECDTFVNNETETSGKVLIQQIDTNVSAIQETDEEINGDNDSYQPDIENDNISPRELVKKGIFSREPIQTVVNIVKDTNLNNENDNPFDFFNKKRSSTVLISPIKVPSESERSSICSEKKASDACLSDPCDFCDRTSKFMCNCCKYFYCKKCLDKLHPALGPYKSHKIIPTDGGIAIEHHDRCTVHGLVAQLFCSYCEQKRCAECASTRCYIHFKGRVSEVDIEREKTILVEELEKATTKLGFLGRYKEKVTSELDAIETTGLLKREQIRQEFISFHDLLINEEAKLLEKLDQDVQERMEHVKNTLKASVETLEREDAVLTTTVTELVQSENAALFIEDCVVAKDLCSQVDDKVRDFNRAWANNSKYSRSRVLDEPFSMFLEKKQLLEKLNVTVTNESQLRFKQNTLFLDDNSGHLHITDYLHIPVYPTSTEVCYTIQLFVRGKLAYEMKTRDLRDTTLNTENTMLLVAGKRYLLKVIPTYKCFFSSLEQCSKQGTPTHMLIVMDYLFQAQIQTGNNDGLLMRVNRQLLSPSKNSKKRTPRKLQKEKTLRKLGQPVGFKLCLLQTIYKDAKKSLADINTADLKRINVNYRREKTFTEFEREQKGNKRGNKCNIASKAGSAISFKGEAGKESYDEHQTLKAGHEGDQTREDSRKIIKGKRNYWNV